MQSALLFVSWKALQCRIRDPLGWDTVYKAYQQSKKGEESLESPESNDVTLRIKRREEGLVQIILLAILFQCVELVAKSFVVLNIPHHNHSKILWRSYLQVQ